jgi:hydroxymethylpyrimidine/phosphomethylpyrimidine kinase
MVRVLVVGGLDPSGAGVDADRAALEGLDVDALVVVTARTKQDDRGVHDVGALEPDAWLKEALAHVERGVDAVKFGLLPGADHVRAATRLARAVHERRPDIAVVVDPVIAASSGTRFLDENAVEALRGELFGEDVIVTPNVPEAAELARLSSETVARSLTARLDSAHFLLGLGARAVIVKGGHAQARTAATGRPFARQGEHGQQGEQGHARTEEPETVSDLVLERDRAPVTLSHARVVGGKVRGSGCRYATRLAARLAQSWTLEEAAKDASEHVFDAIARACRR